MFNFCGCCGARKKKRKRGTNMKKVFTNGRLAPLEIKKPSDSNQDTEELIKDDDFIIQTESDGNVKQDNHSAPSIEPEIVQEVKSDVHKEKDELLKDVDLLLTESDGDIKQENSSPPSTEPATDQEVKPNIVLVEGIKCRSQIKCRAWPGGIYGLRVLYCSGGMQA